MGSIPIEIIFWGCNLMARVSVLHIEGYRFESGHLQVLFFNIFFNRCKNYLFCVVFLIMFFYKNVLVFILNIIKFQKIFLGCSQISKLTLKYPNLFFVFYSSGKFYTHFTLKNEKKGGLLIAVIK